MADETFGINNQPTPPSTNIPNNPLETLVVSSPETVKEPETPALDMDKELEKQLAEVPAAEKSPKKFPVKILAIVFVLLLGGGAIAYFFLGMSSNSTEEVVVNDPPPSFPNPFASSEESEEEALEEETIPTADPAETDLPNPDAPPSLSFPSTTPEDNTTPPVSEEFVETVEDLKVTSDAAANVTETPSMEEVPQKISR